MIIDWTNAKYRRRQQVVAGGVRAWFVGLDTGVPIRVFSAIPTGVVFSAEKTGTVWSAIPQGNVYGFEDR